MKVALILGLAQGKSIIPRLKSIKDNLDIDNFDTIPKFIDMAIKCNSIYDRIIVLSSRVTQTTNIGDLYQYWSSTSRETSIVMICKDKVDDNKAQLFLDTFKTPVAATMMLESTTIQLLAESVLVPAVDLASKYGLKSSVQAEIEEDIYAADIPEPPKPEPVKIEKTASKPQEKRSLVGALFGGKRNKKAGKSVTPVVEQQQVTVPDVEPIDMPVGQQQQESKQEIPHAKPVNSVRKSGSPFKRMSSKKRNMEEPDVSPVSNIEYETQVQEQRSTDTYEDIYDYGEIDEFAQDTDTSDTPIEQPVSNDDYSWDMGGFDQPTEENIETDLDGGSSLDVEEKEDEIFTVQEVADDFEPEVGEEVSFDSLYDPSSPVSETKDPGVDYVSDIDGDLTVGSAEDLYRQQTEKIRVETKVVYKEVPGSGRNVLKRLAAGTAKRILVVTGDRGTGVTSTAFSIASYLAKHMDVLYFDCDTDNHGLLNYIDYNNFRNFETTHINGVKLCKTVSALDRCVIPWEDNLYLLTSDFTCDVTDEELAVTADVVVERSSDFPLVVVDCPFSKLDCIHDLIHIGHSIICIEGTKRGFMNALCGLEGNSLPVKYRTSLASRGRIFVTKCNKNLDLKKLLGYIKAFFEPDPIDWLAMPTMPFDGRLTDKLLNDVLEG